MTIHPYRRHKFLPYFGTGVCNLWTQEFHFPHNRNIEPLGITVRFLRGDWSAWIVVMNFRLYLNVETVRHRREIEDRMYARVLDMIAKKMADAEERCPSVSAGCRENAETGEKP